MRHELAVDVRRHASARSQDWAALGALTVVTAYTAFVWLMPMARVAWFSPSTRLALEVLGVCIALFAVLALLLPDDGDIPVTRNAFIATLVTIGISNAVFGVLPLLLGQTSPFGGVYSFYPWLAARYISGLLFMAAALQRPRLDLRWYLLAVVGVLVAVDAAVYALRDRLPQPFADLEFTAAGVAVAIATPRQTLLIAVLPGVLFGLGAWLALRSYRRGASILYWWVAIALWVQTLSKVHETAYPSVLGPSVTSADLLRLIFFLLLLTGALFKVRQVVLDRGRAVEALAADMEAHRELLTQLEAFTAREETFRSVVVHELATPLATLRAFAHVLTHPTGEHAERRRQVAAEGVQAESRRLQQLVSRMEELRSLELEQFHCDLRPIALRPVVEDASVYLRGLPGGHEPRLRWDCGDVVVDADPDRLGQALRNVLTNAARYAPERTSVEIGCSAEGDRVVVQILDRGPGVDVPERERVVGKFARGTTGAGSEGSGLGLYIVDRIMRAHDGALRLEEGPDGRGLLVVLELRRSRGDRPEAAT
jgi:signal transduction histidine kinase